MLDAPSMENDYLENVTFDELTLGRSASITRTLTKEDIALFATVSGDVNPAHLDTAYANSSMFHGVIGHGMWTGGLVSMVLGTIMPGAGTIYLGQELKFKRPVRLDDRITIKLTVQSKRADKPLVTFDCNGTNQKGETVLEGTASVLAPTQKIRRPRPELPDVEIHAHDHYHAIMEACRQYGPVRTAIVHPVQGAVLSSVVEAAEENLIVPVLVGPKDRIESAAKKSQIDISGWEIVDAQHSTHSIQRAAELAISGHVEAIMKGSVHTEEFVRTITQHQTGLRTSRHISHAFFMDVPNYHKPLVVTDAVVNIDPDLDTKADICQNAIDFWRSLYKGEVLPKVALLAAVETVNSKMPATIDAPALCKMVERGQIHGCMIDGPLTFDNAISKEAALERGVFSTVAGDADILLAPDIEAGSILAKQLTFLSRADAAGIILGAKTPIILIRRADNLRARLASCATAVLLAAAKREGRLK
jgi:phosphate acetyltransferase